MEKKCDICGCTNGSNAHFCGQCGVDLSLDAEFTESGGIITRKIY